MSPSTTMTLCPVIAGNLPQRYSSRKPPPEISLCTGFHVLTSESYKNLSALCHFFQEFFGENLTSK